MLSRYVLKTLDNKTISEGYESRSEARAHKAQIIAKQPTLTLVISRGIDHRRGESHVDPQCQKR